MVVKLISHNPDPEKNIEFCARTCYESFERMENDTYKKMLPVLLKNGHMSLFEHSSASFFIDEISRVCSHQLVRHRLATFSQKSQRYVKESGFGYVVPEDIKNNPEALEVYEDAIKEIQETYEILINLGIKKEKIY